eukprot:CAMPEP_0116854100 /NCGR_PEP_ID=MMETSP0418-20121206/18373_1 /TAXON_ID=1158023 /ORGANISM="Astrosyne radiata, Strain 13vi08-1A" /LENGTH=285 /DNA_ID=CAMNT_0004486761 /DNA_START=216 /DNA_END=1070 /DNA_ORIENTATION=+
MHYHYFGSYTTSGVGPHQGNRGNVQLLKSKDMGVFCISPYDKGGKLYEPSNKLRSLTLPDMEPMAFGASWLWNHDKLGDAASPVHTIVSGVARPSDLDQPAVAAYLNKMEPSKTLKKVKSVVGRLQAESLKVHGEDWVKTCYEGLPKSNVSKYAVEHNQLIWLYNVIKSYGMLEFARDRYRSLEKNRDRWDDSLSVEENIQKIGSRGWGFEVGTSPNPGQDYSDDLAAVPEKNKAHVKEAERFVMKWCGEKRSKGANNKEDETAEEEVPPFEWQTAYKMKPWEDW